jgi:putative membrane protein
MAAITSNPHGLTEPAIHDFSQTELVASVRVADQDYGDHMDWDDGGVWVMFGMMTIFWVGMIALGWWAIASYNRHHESASQSPLDVVRHRYARGEINAEEFERLKRDLG